MAMTGMKDSSKPATTRRVLNFEPSTPSLRSANSLRRFRANTKVSATNRKKMSPDNAAKKISCWLLSGVSVRLNDACHRITTKRMTTPAASNGIALRRRLEVISSGRFVYELATKNGYADECSLLRPCLIIISRGGPRRRPQQRGLAFFDRRMRMLGRPVPAPSRAYFGPCPSEVAPISVLRKAAIGAVATVGARGFERPSLR